MEWIQFLAYIYVSPSPAPGVRRRAVILVNPGTVRPIASKSQDE